MTPQTYKQSDWIVRWAFLFEEVTPLQTSSCAIFWRCAVLSPLKILGPTVLAGLVLSIPAIFLLTTFAPEWLPVSMQPPPRRHEPFPWFIIGPLLGGWGVWFVGQATGFWAWLKRNHCLPVEIEGGLVRKGMCPGLACTGAMILRDDAQWECRKCHGVFSPAAEQAMNE